MTLVENTFVPGGGACFEPQLASAGGFTSSAPASGNTTGLADGTLIFTEWRPSAATAVSLVMVTRGSASPYVAWAHPGICASAGASMVGFVARLSGSAVARSQPIR
eukprot:COSAG02_NODE_130_length_34758_cov_80.817767_4_plen_106_part_00